MSKTIEIHYYNFDFNKKAIAKLPKLKDLLNDHLTNLNISDDDIDLLLSYAYCIGLKDGIDDFSKTLESQGFKIIKSS